MYKLRGRHFRVILPETTYKCELWRCTNRGKVSPECPVSETFRGGLGWVAMELEHQAGFVTIVEEEEEKEEEEKEVKGEEKVERQKQTGLKSFWCQRL